MSKIKFMFKANFKKGTKNYQIKKGHDIYEIKSDTKLGKFLFFWLRVIPFGLGILCGMVITLFGDEFIRIYSRLFNVSELSVFHNVIALVFPVIILIIFVIFVVSLLIPKEYKEYV